ncbi:MAG: hypothetical protein JW940_37735, partial [Polyangiaceae bacterium]|nr:hypothetical protein [Polyangiaceae bacterium]
MIKTKYAVWVGAVMMVACAAKMKVDEGGAGGRAAASGAGGDAGRSGAPGSSLELGGGAGEGASDSQSSPATPFAGGQGGRGTDTTGTGGEVDENTTGSRANAAGGYGGSHSNASIPSAAGEGGLRTEAAGAGGDGVGMSCHEDFLGSDATDRPGEGLSSNATGCPSKPPDYASVCQTDEGLVCAYLGSDDRNDYYTECQCVAVSRTELRWDCDVRHNGDFESCPETAPQDGDPCSDPFLSCYYPVRVDCACLTDDDAGDAVWDCEEPASDLPEPTPDVYASLPVGQLSSGEIAAWCDWYLDVMYDGDDSQDAVVRVHGDFAQAMPQNCLGLATNAFLPRLTKALCEQNMALSTCEAP